MGLLPPKILGMALVALGATFGAANDTARAVTAGTSVLGTWLSADGGTKVRIVDCGGRLCGTVVWLSDAIGADGKPKTDKHNADASKRARPLLGVTVVQGMAPDGANKWSGAIYNADDGKTYQAHVTVLSANSIKVQGCVLRILCKSHVWTRAD